MTNTETTDCSAADGPQLPEKPSRSADDRVFTLVCRTCQRRLTGASNFWCSDQCRNNDQELNARKT